MVLPANFFTPTTKTGNEIVLYYNMGVGQILKRVGHNSETDETVICNAEACPQGSFEATVLHTVTGYVQSAMGAIPANAPIWSATEGFFNPAEDGVHAWHVCLPNPADDQLICYDQGFEASPGLTLRTIPRKFNPADHYVLQRAEHTIRISDMYVSNFTGLSRIRGRRCTIIAKIYPSGGSRPQEVHYFSNVILNVSPISGNADGNASIEITGDGNYSWGAIFAAQPA